MATYKHLRSSTANKRPTTSITDGQLAINTNTASPGLFFKDSAGTGIVKVGPVHVGTTAPNATPAAGGSSGNYTGEQWLDTSVSPAQMKVWNGSAWVGVVADELPVSKLQDGAARQLLQTDAAGTGVEWTSNVDVPGTLDVTGATTLDSTLTVPLGSAAAPTVRFTGDTNTGIYSPGADQVAVATNGAGRLFVDANGRVGVGVASPDTTLHVVGDTSALGEYAVLSVSDVSDTTKAVRIAYDDVNDVGVITASDRGAGYKNLVLQPVDGRVGIGAVFSPGAALEINAGIATSPFIAKINTAEAARIDGNGRLGIKTSTPGYLLHLGGESIAAPNGQIALGLIAATNPSARIDGYRVDGSFAGELHLYTTSGGGTQTRAVTIDSSQRVGIGTSNPAWPLDVNGIAKVKQAVLFEAPNSTNRWDLYTNTDDTFRFNYNGSGNDEITITSGGNVGIGSTVPNEKLTVADSGSANVYIALQNSTTGTTSADGWYLGAAGTEFQIYGKENGPITFSPNSTERARLTSDGKFLVGTSSSPSLTDGQYSKLHVIANTNTASGEGIINIGRGQAASSAFAPGTGLGNLFFTDSAGAVHAAVGAATDGTTGAGDYPGRLVFSTTADGASSPTERMRITQAGHLYIANTTGDYNTVGITLFSNGQAQANANGVNPLNLNRKGSDGKIVDFYRDTNNPGSISVTTTATTYATSSDYRLKENVTPVTDGITRLQQLRPSRFNFIADPAKTVDGFIAHEAQAVVPECVTGTKDEVDADGNPIYQGIDQSKLVPLLTAALQEAIAKIEALEARLTAAGI
jgi:hypothetical protein